MNKAKFCCIVFCLILLSIFTTSDQKAFAAFIISGESSCNGSDTYAFHFSNTAIYPDVSVKVGSTAIYPDITMKLVSDPNQADLIFFDELKDSSMKVCKKNSSLGVKNIKVSSTTIYPDVTVKLSENPFSPDYKIFISSESFTNEEAAALFAAIWHSSRKK